MSILDTIETCDLHAHLNDNALVTEFGRRANQVAAGQVETLSWANVHATVESEVRGAKRQG